VSANWESLGPRVTITREDGSARTFPLEMQPGGDYFDIAQSPDEGFPPPIAIGPPEQRTDLRTRQTITRDNRRGMGLDELDETQGTASFRYSQWDTRFANVRVMRPLPVRLGSSTTVGTTGMARVAYVGAAVAEWFAYSGGTASYYSKATSQWVATTLTNGSFFFHEGAGGLYYIWDTFQKMSQSSDGVTWNTVDLSDIDTAVTSASPPLIYGVVTHDQKLFTVARDDPSSARVFTLFQSVDGTQAPTTANWTRLGSLTLGRGEQPACLFTWKFPPQPQRNGIFLQTNRGYYWYDDTADAASLTAWKKWHTWDQPYNQSDYPFSLTWGRTGDLYGMPSLYQPNLWQFTGSTITPQGPNRRGGLPPSRLGVVYWAAANSHAIVAWVRPGGGIGTANTGMVAAFNEQEGWHHLFDPTNTGDHRQRAERQRRRAGAGERADGAGQRAGLGAGVRGLGGVAAVRDDRAQLRLDRAGPRRREDGHRLADAAEGGALLRDEREDPGRGERGLLLPRGRQRPDRELHAAGHGDERDGDALPGGLPGEYPLQADRDPGAGAAGDGGERHGDRLFEHHARDAAAARALQHGVSHRPAPGVGAEQRVADGGRLRADGAADLAAGVPRADRGLHHQPSGRGADDHQGAGGGDAGGVGGDDAGAVHRAGAVARNAREWIGVGGERAGVAPTPPSDYPTPMATAPWVAAEQRDNGPPPD
jgi:hypothetical protein